MDRSVVSRHILILLDLYRPRKNPFIVELNCFLFQNCNFFAHHLLHPCFLVNIADTCIPRIITFLWANFFASLELNLSWHLFFLLGQIQRLCSKVPSLSFYRFNFYCVIDFRNKDLKLVRFYGDLYRIKLLNININQLETFT